MQPLDLSDSLVRNLLLLSTLMLPVKALATWRAAQNKQKVWFGALFVFNTVGLLDIMYLLYFSKAKPTKD